MRIILMMLLAVVSSHAAAKRFTCEQVKDKEARASCIETRSKDENKHKALAQWAEEPSSFLGIELGKPLPVIFRRSCDDLPPADVATKCVLHVRYQPLGMLIGGTNSPIPRRNLHGKGILVYTLDNTVESPVGAFETDFISEDFDQVVEMFIVKYGKPHSEKVNKVKTQGGAEYDNKVLSWKGKNVFIQVESLADRRYHGMFKKVFDYGSVNVFTTEYLEKKSQENYDSAKKRAVGL